MGGDVNNRSNELPESHTSSIRNTSRENEVAEKPLIESHLVTLRASDTTRNSHKILGDQCRIFMFDQFATSPAIVENNHHQTGLAMFGCPWSGRDAGNGDSLQHESSATEAILLCWPCGQHRDVKKAAPTPALSGQPATLNSAVRNN